MSTDKWVHITAKNVEDARKAVELERLMDECLKTVVRTVARSLNQGKLVMWDDWEDDKPRPCAKHNLLQCPYCKYATDD